MTQAVILSLIWASVIVILTVVIVVALYSYYSQENSCFIRNSALEKENEELKKKLNKFENTK